MRRMHEGMKVTNLDKVIAFYSRLFGAKPTLQRHDYAKWILDDPRINFSIDTHGDGEPGSAYYGIQVETPGELEKMRQHIAHQHPAGGHLKKAHPGGLRASARTV